MSSGPMGLDVHEYSYGYQYYLVPTALPDMYRMSTGNAWLVTRVRYWAAAVAGGLAFTSIIPVAANGCLCLEPNGAHREDIVIFGLGSVVLVEYWFQARPDGTKPAVTVVVI